MDVLSDYDHPDAEQLMASVEETVHRTVSLVEAARERSILIVYVNDNFQDWALDRQGLLKRVTDGPHRRLVEPLAPHEADAFVLKGAGRWLDVIGTASRGDPTDPFPGGIRRTARPYLGIMPPCSRADPTQPLRRREAASSRRPVCPAPFPACWR